VVAQEPHVAGNRDGRLRRLGRGVFVRVAGDDFFRLAEQIFQLVVGKPGEIEVEAVVADRLQLDAQHFLVPAGIERQAVVGQNKGAPLRFGQMVEDDDRDFGHVQFACGEQAGVAGDDDPVRPGQDGVGPPELGYRGRDLGDLFVTMRARVPGVRDQPFDRPRHHLQVLHALPG